MWRTPSCKQTGSPSWLPLTRNVRQKAQFAKHTQHENARRRNFCSEDVTKESLRTRGVGWTTTTKVGMGMGTGMGHRRAIPKNGLFFLFHLRILLQVYVTETTFKRADSPHSNVPWQVFNMSLPPRPPPPSCKPEMKGWSVHDVKCPQPFSFFNCLLNEQSCR
jgi:hypothetical protein